MKYRFNLFFLVSVFCLHVAAQNKKPTPTAIKKTVTNTKPSNSERNISITYTPYKNCWIYLGSYYGKNQVLVDSTWLNNESKGNFKGKEKYTGGIYFIVSPKRNQIMFEFLMDNKQQFSIVADTLQKEKQIITGSPENDLFNEYTKISSEKGIEMQQIRSMLPSATNAADSNLLIAKYRKAERELQDYREKVMKEKPNSLLATLFHVMKRPETPAVPIVNGKPDSLYPYLYVKNHFWDDVDFTDDRVLRTPFFDGKVDDYFKYYISPEADSIIPEVKYMLLSSRSSKEVFPYLLTKFTNKYVNPEYMGQDKVFLYLFNDFYSKGDTLILNPASRKMIFERAYSLMANQIGEPAPQLNLIDTLGVKQNMYNLKATFTLIVFWDPTCGHCKEQIPRIDSIYKAKWKGLDLKVYSVYVYDDHLAEWKKFINEKELYDWVHVYQPKAEREYEAKNNIPNFRQLYDARVTPTIYLLDENKRILAKQLTLEQFDEVISAKLKNKKN